MIIQKAMAKRPQDRYESMDELDEALAPWDPGEGEAAPLALTSNSAMWMRATSSGTRRSESIDKQIRTVAMARPLILLFGVLGLFWAAGNLLMGITAVVRIVRGAGAKANLEPTEALFLVLGLVFTLLTPVGLAGRFLAREVWGNSVKAVDLAERLRRPVLVGLSAYGFATLMVRILESVLLRRAVGVAWPWWDVLLMVISVAAVAGVLLLARAEKPKNA
jgi:serine/threonine-protein kinase